MKKSMKVILPVAFGMMLFTTSCNKCEECHYDGPDGEVEIGEICGDELEDREQNGYAVNDTIYEVHCHEH
jgi:hypothetical protein